MSDQTSPSGDYPTTSRNRVKRQIRAAIRPLIPAISPGWDVIILARQPAANETFPQINAAIRALLKRAKLTDNENVN